MLKLGTGKHDTVTPTYKGMKKKYYSTNNVEYKFWFCPNGIKYCVIISKNKHVLDYPNYQFRWVPISQSKRCWLLKTVEFICSKGRHFLLVIGFLQLLHYQSLVAFPFAMTLGCPPCFQVWEDGMSQSDNTDGGSQKQMGELHTHRWLQFGCSQCHFMSRLWSENQHCLQ